MQQTGQNEHHIARRFEDFKKMHKRLRLELPGKILPPLPKKNASDQTMSIYDDDTNSESSVSTQGTGTHEPGRRRSLLPSLPFPAISTTSANGHRRTLSAASPLSPRDSTGSLRSARGSPRPSPRASVDSPRPVTLIREAQRVSLRAALRNLLQLENIAQSAAMQEFLTHDPIKLTAEELMDIDRRKLMDERRIEEQKQFYEIAARRAAELDVHMEKFRREIVERNGLTKLFTEIREKKTIAELSPEYQKFAEWARIE